MKLTKGLTLIELIIVIGIFSLFLVAFYAVMDVGLKQWKIGEVRSDIQTTAQWVMNRITGELTMANLTAINAAYNPSDPNDLNTYISFETPVYNSVLQNDPNTGNLYWQGYIIYYTLPDPSSSELHSKILYRRFIPHSNPPSNDRTSPTLINNISSYLNTSPPVATGEEYKKVCDRLISAKFEHNFSIVNIELTFQENIRKSKDTRISFSSGNNLGIEKFALKGSVKPKN